MEEKNIFALRLFFQIKTKNSIKSRVIIFKMPFWGFKLSNSRKNEPETYISSTSYFAQIEARARYFGHIAGFEMGEPFKKLNGKIGLSSFNNIV